ncbi:carbohydrate ABC transporter permease [Brachybacterium tyrofermentans]|uniref:carbohydrate ABC transporter permease n=1 Tax=Brachybacterium tyrofermentans TaxID=47848 RepID=UPI003FD131E8
MSRTIERSSRLTRQRRVFTTIGLVICALYIVPMAFVALVSLTPDGMATDGSIPDALAPDNYLRAIASTDFLLYLSNSLVISVVAVVAQVALSTSAGYALAKLPLPGKSWILLLIVALLVIPPEVVLVPLFLIMLHVPLIGGNGLLGSGGTGLLDSYTGMIIPHVVSALGIFLMRQFYAGLPDELGDSARVDGASEARIFLRIYTPLTLPAVTVVAVLAFQAAWNDFLWPLILIRSDSMQPLQLGLTVFYQENSTQWNLLMAAVLMMSIPVLAIFLFSQRFFRSGITAGAVK